MITDRTGQHEFLLPINHNYNAICDISSFFNIKTRDISRDFFLEVKKKPIQVRARDSRTIQILRYRAYCNVNADIRVADSQSDLRILL